MNGSQGVQAVAGARRSRTRRLAASGALACAALAVVPVVAQAAIVPGRSVAGVQLGATTAQVRATLGAPDAGSNILNYRYIARRGLGVYFIAGKAYEITVVKGPQKTAKGIGIGSTRAAVTTAYPKATCAKAVTGVRTFECTLPGRFAGRATRTVFTTKSGKVSEITVGYVGG